MLGAPVFRTALFGPWSGNALWTAARAAPSLDLCFADKKDLICASSGRQLVTFARASSGTYTDSAGVLSTAATDVPRFDHNPLTGESLGLLVEEQRTNLLLRSEEFDNASWSSAAGARTVTANQIAAPDGTTTADLVTADGTTAAHFVSQSLTLSAVPYTYSVFAKAGTNNFLQFRFFSAFGGGLANFNLATGVVGTLSGSATSSIQAYPNGWYRCTIGFTPTAATSSVGIYIVSSASASGGEINSLSTSVYLWGADLQAGATASSYIPTTTAAATRNADVVQITGTNFSSWYRQDEGTWFAEGKRDGTADGRFLGLSTGSINNTYVLTTNASRTAIISSVSGGSFGGGVTTANSFAYQNPIKLAASISALLNENICLNGGVVATGSTTTPVGTLTTLDIGTQSGAATAFFNGTIKRLTYWPQALPGQLQAITQP